VGIFGSLLRVGVGVVRGAVGGGIPGAIVGGVAGVAVQRAVTSIAPPVVANPFGQGQPRNAVVPVPGVTGAIQRFLPGGQTGYTTSRAMTKDGRMRRIRKDGRPWSPPHMNPMNPRAARRAITRIKGARKLLHRIEASLPKRRAEHHVGGKRAR
jgi:hypothetical protein